MIGFLLAAQIAVVAHAPDTATTCAPIEVTVAARAAGAVAPSIAPPAVGGSLQLLRSTVVSRVEQDGGGGSSAIAEATFLLATDAWGKVTLPPFVASLGALRGSASVPPLDVRGSNGALPPTVVVRAWLDLGGHAATADTLFVGQQVDYVVDVQLNESARQRLRHNPTFFPPEMPGVLAYDLAPPVAVSRAGHRCFETLSYRRALFPLFAGRTTIAPAALTYSLPLSTSFFSREENVELHTDSVRFTAEEVPVAGRPADFVGAVGALAASARLASAQARMGDPVVLTLRLEGSGNVKLWPRPALALPWASMANGDERVVVDTSGSRVRGSKEFDWLLTPRTAGRQEVPALDYHYFDADRRAYEAARTIPLALDVAVASLAALDSAPVTKLPVRRTLRDELPAPVPTHPWYWALLVMAPVPAALRRVQARRRRTRVASSPMRRLAIAARVPRPAAARQVRRLYLDALAERIPTVAGATHADSFRRSLRRAGVTDKTADAATDLFERLDAAAFSPSGALDENAMQAAGSIAASIDAEAVRNIPGAGAAVAVALILSCVMAATLAALPEGSTRTFAQGVDAYDKAAFPAAALAFSRVAERAPRAVDAWANLGTAAWSRNDSAAAARAWQRALRLDPLDADVRERLDGIVAASIRSPGYVAPLPVDVVALGGLALWIVAWLTLFIPPARRPKYARALAGGAIVVAVVLVAATLEVRDRLDPRGLGVLRVTGMLLEGPGSQNSVASGATGETGVIGARDGAWVRIDLGGGRAGWVPVSNVLPLDAPAADN